MSIDVKYFYLNEDLKRYVYMWVPRDMIPKDIIEEYKIQPLFKQGCILAEI